MLGFQMHDSILVLHHAGYPDEPWCQDHSPILLINVASRSIYVPLITYPFACCIPPFAHTFPRPRSINHMRLANPTQTRACSPLTSTLAGRTGRNWRSSNLAAGSACHV